MKIISTKLKATFLFDKLKCIPASNNHPFPPPSAGAIHSIIENDCEKDDNLFFFVNFNAQTRLSYAENN